MSSNYITNKKFFFSLIITFSLMMHISSQLVFDFTIKEKKTSSNRFLANNLEKKGIKGLWQTRFLTQNSLQK
jgi:hypothetical protein